MQIAFIGKFQSGSTHETAARLNQSDDYSENQVVFLEDTRQAIEGFDAGLSADIVVCGPEIDMSGLTSNLDTLGISVPNMIQPDKKPENSGAEDGSRMADSCSWIGSETNPLRLGQSLVDMERTLILQTLTHCGGNRTHAADILGISSRTLRTKLQQYSAEGCTVVSSRFRQSGQSSSSSEFTRPHGVLVS